MAFKYIVFFLHTIFTRFIWLPVTSSLLQWSFGVFSVRRVLNALYMKWISLFWVFAQVLRYRSEFFTRYVGVSTINNCLTVSYRVVVDGIRENKLLLVPKSKIINVCYLRKMGSLLHCFFHSDVPHSHLWSLSVLNTISIMMSLLMLSVRSCITQMVQILRNPSLCLEAALWLMFISDAISSLPLFCCPGYVDRSAL